MKTAVKVNYKKVPIISYHLWSKQGEFMMSLYIVQLLLEGEVGNLSNSHSYQKNARGVIEPQAVYNNIKTHKYTRGHYILHKKHVMSSCVKFSKSLYTYVIVCKIVYILLFTTLLYWTSWSEPTLYKFSSTRSYA